MSEANQTTARKTILVIDDDESIRILLRTVLELEGYLVLEASDGVTGQQEYGKNPTDLVIMDLIMPGKEGIETIRDLRREFPDVKIIAVSGGGRIGAESYLKMAKGLGALRTLRKPFDRESLVKTVAEAIKMDAETPHTPHRS
ncbi:response regulator receiver domain protein [delta proteobacterium NaphS2]|nr:response regulator receiver domain protein [delta proteobacterium NaphS2]